MSNYCEYRSGSKCTIFKNPPNSFIPLFLGKIPCELPRYSSEISSTCVCPLTQTATDYPFTESSRDFLIEIINQKTSCAEKV